jgi:hypothetical protein
MRRRSAAKKKPKFDLKGLLTPLNAVIAVVVVAVAIGLVYLNIQFNKFQNTPEIRFVSPENNQIVETESVNILGIVDENSDLFLEGEEVEVADDGEFEKEVELEEGVNTISFEAVNRNNSELKTVESLRIEYRKPEDVKGEETEEPSEPVTFETYLQILGEETWVQYIVDDTQKYAQVLAPGKTEVFEMTKSVEVVTGKPQSTRLYINDKVYELKVNPDSGVASISCTVKGDTIDCSE